MLGNDFRLPVLAVAVLAGAGGLLLCLVVLDLASALCGRLWLLASPGAARAARFQAALAAYRGRTRRRGRRTK